MKQSQYNSIKTKKTVSISTQNIMPIVSHWFYLIMFLDVIAMHDSLLILKIIGIEKSEFRKRHKCIECHKKNKIGIMTYCLRCEEGDA